MTEKLNRYATDLDTPNRFIGTAAGPGKSTLTSRHVMRRARDNNGVAAGADAAIDAASGSSGAPLPAELRGRFETSLGADLSSVRVHAGDSSATASDAVGARAYTIGQDIHFGAGQYAPATSEGQLLIAHEVAHTVQQQGASPHRQNKLSVSTPGDAAEVEADRAASAMVTGAPTALTPGAGGVMRDEIAPIEIGPDESLNQTLHDEQNDTHKNIDSNWGFNSGSLIDPKTGEANAQNEVAKNLAKKDLKTQEDTKRLAEECDSLKPLTEAYMLPQTNIDTLIAKFGIDADNPELYRKDVLDLHQAMDAKTSTNTNASNASKALTDLWGQAQTAKNVVGATKKVSALTTELQMVKNELTKVQNNLLAAKAQKDIKDNQAELDKIDAKVKQISGIITGVAKVTAAVASLAATGGASAPTALDAMASTLTMEQSFALVAMQNEHDANEGSFDAKAGKAIGGVGKGADWVAGKGDMIESGLKSIVFKEQIDGFKSKISSLEGDIAALGIKNEGLTLENATLAIDRAQKGYEQACVELANSKDKFQQSMQDIGRYFDRMHIDDTKAEGKEEAAVQGPGTAPGHKVSMETVMSMYASLQKRGAARGAMLDMLKSCKHIKDAEAIMAKALDDSAGHPMMLDPADWSGSQTLPVAMDQDFTGLGLRSKQQIADAGAMRKTVAAVLTITGHAEGRDPGETACEGAWEKMITEAMSGIAK